MKNNEKDIEKDTGCLTAAEPALATAQVIERVLPEDIDYACIVDNVLQITPDIEEEIAEVERGEKISMNEFNTMFAKWLD